MDVCWAKTSKNITTSFSLNPLLSLPVSFFLHSSTSSPSLAFSLSVFIPSLYLFYRWAGRCDAVQSPGGFEGQRHPQRASRDVQLLPAESGQRGRLELCHPASLPARSDQQQRWMCSPAVPACQCPPSSRHANSCRCDLWHSVHHDGGRGNLRLRLCLADGAVPEGAEEPRPASDGRVRSRDGHGGRANELPRGNATQRGLRHRARVSNQQLLTHCCLLI